MMARWRRVLKSERGSSMIEFLALTPLLVFLAFFPINTYMMQLDRAFLDAMKDKYLQRAQIDGGITAQAWVDLRSDIQARGMDYALVRFDGSSQVGTVLLRGETIALNIGYPRGNALSLLRLIGGTDDPNRFLWARGTILSERPRP